MHIAHVLTSLIECSRRMTLVFSNVLTGHLGVKMFETKNQCNKPLRNRRRLRRPKQEPQLHRDHGGPGQGRGLGEPDRPRGGRHEEDLQQQQGQGTL